MFSEGHSIGLKDFFSAIECDNSKHIVGPFLLFQVASSDLPQDHIFYIDLINRLLGGDRLHI